MANDLGWLVIVQVSENDQSPDMNSLLGYTSRGRKLIYVPVLASYASFYLKDTLAYFHWQ